VRRDESPHLGGRGSRTSATKSVPSLDEPADSVPAHRPWFGRPDAHQVEIRYRRSVHYWRRRKRAWGCDREAS
jgi:hypothetical protein